MAFSLLEAEIFVQRPLDVEYRDGMFHVVDHYGQDCVVRKAIPPHVYIASVRRANAALAEWQAENREVIPFPTQATG